MKEKLEELFKIVPWPDDPETKQGKEYFNSTIQNMQKLFEHSWFKNFLKKEKLRILEICGGAGFGGVALSKLLLEKNLDIDLTITDLRESVLKKAKKWGEKVLGKKITIKVIDAREVYKMKEKFDIVLMYGFSASPFDPWEIIKLFSSVCQCLEREKGMFIFDEVDRRYHIFLLTGYKWALCEGNEEKFVMSFHVGYDVLRGTFSRIFFNPILSKSPIKLDFYYWGIAEIGAITYLFFKDIDFINIGGTRNFILGYKPRGLIKPQDVKEPFLFIKNKIKKQFNK